MVLRKTMPDLHLIIGSKTYSSWSLRPWLAVNFAGLVHRESVVPLDTPEFHAAKTDGRLPAARVPVLWVDDHCVWDSLAIIEYVAEQFPALWPADPTARALARSVSAEMHSGFQKLRQHLPMNVRRRGKAFALTDEVVRDVQRIADIWAQCRNSHGRDGDFLFGAFSAADCMFAPVVTRFDSYAVPLPTDAQAYANAVLAHPLMQRWYAEAAAEPWSLQKYDSEGDWL
jgi:glutathione S-transferase